MFLHQATYRSDGVYNFIALSGADLLGVVWRGVFSPLTFPAMTGTVVI